MHCIVDCRIDESLQNNFLELNLWGKPSYVYVIDEAEQSGCFSHITVITQSDKIAKNCKRANIKIIRYFPEISGDVFIISGRAPCISAATIKKALFEYDGGEMISSHKEGEFHFDNETISFYAKTCNNAFNAFRILNKGVGKTYYYNVPDVEAVVINSVNEFELALILKKKQQNRNIVISMIKKRIEEKKLILSTSIAGKSICLIGHSQLDKWDIKNIVDYKVRNCAISGISSFEYNDFILAPKMLNCQADLFLIMHGTNDIVWDYTVDEMVSSIKKTIEYVRNNNACAPILFLSNIHTNGRLDRSNQIIDKLNTNLKEALKNQVIWVDMSFMDDEYGDLDALYTTDGLHINDVGYDALKKEVEKNILEIR